jgi:hypothetical protein
MNVKLIAYQFGRILFSALILMALAESSWLCASESRIQSRASLRMISAGLSDIRVSPLGIITPSVPYSYLIHLP